MPNYTLGSIWQSSYTLAKTHSVFMLTLFVKATFSKKNYNSLITNETEYADDFAHLLLWSVYPSSLPIRILMCSCFCFLEKKNYKSTSCIKDINFSPIFICLLAHFWRKRSLVAEQTICRWGKYHRVHRNSPAEVRPLTSPVNPLANSSNSTCKTYSKSIPFSLRTSTPTNLLPAFELICLLLFLPFKTHPPHYSPGELSKTNWSMLTCQSHRKLWTTEKERINRECDRGAKCCYHVVISAIKMKRLYTLILHKMTGPIYSMKRNHL